MSEFDLKFPEAAQGVGRAPVYEPPSGSLMKKAVVAAAVGGLAYLVYSELTSKPGKSVLGEVMSKVASQDTSGTGLAAKAEDDLSRGKLGAAAKDATESALKGTPFGKIAEAANPSNSKGDRVVSAGFGVGGIVFPPLNIAGWLLPSGDKGSADYWENLPEREAKSINDLFTGSDNSTRFQAFGWKPPGNRENLYRQLWYDLRGWYDDRGADPHPENGYKPFWNDSLTKQRIAQYEASGGHWSQADENFMSRWFDYNVYWDFKRRGKLADYDGMVASGKIKSGASKTQLYRKLNLHYYYWLLNRKNPLGNDPSQKPYEAFWDDPATKKILQGQNWDPALDAQFMNLSFGVQNADVYWNEQAHGRLDKKSLFSPTDIGSILFSGAPRTPGQLLNQDAVDNIVLQREGQYLTPY